MGNDPTPVVLIIEDNPALANVYTEWLEHEYSVIAVHTGADAMSELESAIDIVVLDQVLPDMTGTQVLNAIHPGNIRCRVAMVTGVELTAESRATGVDEYLIKPVSRRDLQTTVRRLLRVKSFQTESHHLQTLASTIATLEAENDLVELTENAGYNQLLDEFSTRKQRMSAIASSMGSQDFEPLFYDFNRP